MVIATATREALSMQEMVGGDYFRTPVIFEVPDNCVFVENLRNLILCFLI